MLAWAAGWQKKSVRIFCRIIGNFTHRCVYLVYGPENVSSGASSDIRNATSTASAMVRVCLISHFTLPMTLAHLCQLAIRFL